MTAINRLYLPVFALTMLSSALLLFAMEPLIGKMILPLLGGSPQVWNTAMLFFQIMLLAGYGWAHGTSRLLGVRAQALVQLALLAFFVVFLPLALPKGWVPPSDTGNPAFWQLGLMLVTCGGPFFVLAASTPILQRWFAATPHRDAHDPYFLYAVSNLGSLVALLSYPTVIEPLLTVPGQTHLWAIGYGALGLLTLLAAALVWPFGTKALLQKAKEAAPAPPLRLRQCLHWLLLSFLPSSLMLGVTTYITTDLAAAPLIWVIPLALYIGTFVIAFARSYTLPQKPLLFVHAFLLALAIALLVYNILQLKLPLILIHLLLFFAAALVCHTQLAASRPDARHLTAYYLIMAAGGVLGGIFNALLAPLIFLIPVEYVMVLAAIAFIRPAQRGRSAAQDKADSVLAVIAIAAAGLDVLFWRSSAVSMICGAAIFTILMSLHRSRMAFALTVTMVLTLHSGLTWNNLKSLKHLSRNFFGIAKVTDGLYPGMRTLMHGTTVHGAQSLSSPYNMVPMTYYYPMGPAGDIFGLLDKRPESQNVAAIGLGVGSIACYIYPGRRFDFYEIDPAIAKIATDPKLFTYLSSCGSPYTITLGDGRLKIAQAPDQSYDLIFLDAFSSDNIPVHLLTKEAFGIYKRKLKPGGLLVTHISNRFLNLAPVVASVAAQGGMAAVFRSDENGGAIAVNAVYSPSIYGVLAAEQQTLAPLRANDRWRAYTGTLPRPWTDDYANILGALWIGGPKLPTH